MPGGHRLADSNGGTLIGAETFVVIIRTDSGEILLFLDIRALRYSIPNILLGEERTSLSSLKEGAYCNNAQVLAMGKDIPLRILQRKDST